MRPPGTLRRHHRNLSKRHLPPRRTGLQDKKRLFQLVSISNVLCFVFFVNRENYIMTVSLFLFPLLCLLFRSMNQLFNFPCSNLPTCAIHIIDRIRCPTATGNSVIQSKRNANYCTVQLVSRKNSASIRIKKIDISVDAECSRTIRESDANQS